VAAGEVGGVDLDLPVEAARAQERRIEDVGAVGRGDQDHAAADVEAVHLDQQLVEGLLALVVTAAHAGAAVAAHGVDLVDEDDRRGVLLGLLEEVADAARADTHEHLDEVRPGDGVEGHARLARDRAGEQRLAGAGRTVEQHALRDLGADRLELGRLLKELLDLAELLDRFLTARDVTEGGLRHVLGDQLGLGLGELHHATAATTLHLVHQEEEEEHDQHERQQGGQDRCQQARLGDLVVVAVGRDRLLRDLGLDLLDQGVLRAVEPVRGDLGARGAYAVLQGRLDLLVAVDQGDLLHLSRGDVGVHRRELHLVVPAGGGEVLQGEEHADHCDDDPQPGASDETLHGTLSKAMLLPAVALRERPKGALVWK
jgi:hypothetical protein